MSLSSSSFKEESQTPFPLSVFSYKNLSASQKNQNNRMCTCSTVFVVIFTCNRYKNRDEMTTGHIMVWRSHGMPRKHFWERTWKTHSITTLRPSTRADTKHTGQRQRTLKELLCVGFSSIFVLMNLGDSVCT